MVTNGVALGAAVFALGFGIETTIAPPDHARVLVDVANGYYVSPPCIETYGRTLKDWERVRNFLKEIRLGEVRATNRRRVEPIRPWRECGAHPFNQEGRSLSGYILETIGILPDLESRWTKDGSWRW